jgi:hypothetical protein
MECSLTRCSLPCATVSWAPPPCRACPASAPSSTRTTACTTSFSKTFLCLHLLWTSTFKTGLIEVSLVIIASRYIPKLMLSPAATTTLDFSTSKQTSSSTATPFQWSFLESAFQCACVSPLSFPKPFQLSHFSTTLRQLFSSETACTTAPSRRSQAEMIPPTASLCTQTSTATRLCINLFRKRSVSGVKAIFRSNSSLKFSSLIQCTPSLAVQCSSW